MGWLFMSSLGGHNGPREYLDAEFTCERPGRSSKVLRSALVRMRTYYAAVEVLAEGREREVWDCVCLVKYNPRDCEGYIFGYKSMEEGMGPCETECPVAILELLTPTSNDYALKWRSACRERAATRAAKPKLRHGQLVTFAEPLRFVDGRTHQTLRVDIDPRFARRVRFRALDGRGLYSISGLAKLAYTMAPSLEAQPKSRAAEQGACVTDTKSGPPAPAKTHNAVIQVSIARLGRPST